MHRDLAVADAPPTRSGHDSPSSDRCGVTKKVRFHSQAGALTRAGEILQTGTTTQFRAYLCQYCAGWHLTSK